MGAPQRDFNFKNTKIGQMLSESLGLLFSMANSVDYDEDNLTEAIQKTIEQNPEEKDLDKFKEIAELVDKDLEQQAERFKLVEQKQDEYIKRVEVKETNISHTEGKEREEREKQR